MLQQLELQMRESAKKFGIRKGAQFAGSHPLLKQRDMAGLFPSSRVSPCGFRLLDDPAPQLIQRIKRIAARRMPPCLRVMIVERRSM